MLSKDHFTNVSPPPPFFNLINPKLTL